MTAVTEVVGRVEAVYRQDGDRLWRALLAFASDPEVASDAVAEAFAQALRREALLRDVQAWVWRAAYRIAAGELKRRRTTTFAVPDGAYHDAAIDTDLLEVLARLPDGQRIAVTLFYYADAPVSEISRLTGSSALAVRANLSRGRKRMRQLIGDRDG